jgi:hypothetical protein
VTARYPKEFHVSVVELLHSYGHAFWCNRKGGARDARQRDPNVSVSQRGDGVEIRHPGFFEPVELPYEAMRSFDDVDAAVLMSCRPTGRHGYISCFRREVLVRATGEALSEEMLRGSPPAVLSSVCSGELTYRLGPVSHVLKLILSHLYPVKGINLDLEYSISVEPAYLEEVRNDDLSERLEPMNAEQQLENLCTVGDVAVDRYLVELSGVMGLHLGIWDMPDALELALVQKQRRSDESDPHRIAQVFPYRRGMREYLRAIRVNEPRMRIFALLRVLEVYFRGRHQEQQLARLSELLQTRGFDAQNRGHLQQVLEITSEPRELSQEQERSALFAVLEDFVDHDELASALRGLWEDRVVTTLSQHDELAAFLLDLRDVVSGAAFERRSRIGVQESQAQAYLPLIQWLTMTVMRGEAMQDELLEASTEIG